MTTIDQLRKFDPARRLHRGDAAYAVPIRVAGCDYLGIELDRTYGAPLVNVAFFMTAGTISGDDRRYLRTKRQLLVHAVVLYITHNE